MGMMGCGVLKANNEIIALREFHTFSFYIFHYFGLSKVNQNRGKENKK